MSAFYIQSPLYSFIRVECQTFILLPEYLVPKSCRLWDRFRGFHPKNKNKGSPFHMTRYVIVHSEQRTKAGIPHSPRERTMVAHWSAHDSAWKNRRLVKRFFRATKRLPFKVLVSTDDWDRKDAVCFVRCRTIHREDVLARWRRPPNDVAKF